MEVESGPAGRARGDSAWRIGALLFGVSGFVALSCELVWFRLLNVMLKSSAFVFGTLIGMYVVGLGSGAAIGSLLVRRARRPQRTFLSLQALVVPLPLIGIPTFLSGLSFPFLQQVVQCSSARVSPSQRWRLGGSRVGPDGW